MRMDGGSGIQLLEVSDASGQHCITVTEIEADAPVSELVERALAELELNREDSQGRALSYQARLEREGRALNGAERAGDVLQSRDRVTLQPSIDAGAGSHSR
jgi:hypothetical protein